MSGVVNRTWPTGPDGYQLPAGADGQPVWPSEQYRRDYEQAMAQQAAARDRRAPVRRTVLAIVLVIVAVVVAVVVIRDVTQGGKQGQREACTFYRQNNIPPPPDQNCP